MSAKVTSVTTTLSETDLMENIRTFVEVEGLTVNNVEFRDNTILVTANYHKVIDIPFLAQVRIVSVADNIVRIKIEKIKVLKMGIPNAVLSTALKFGLKKAEDMGITYDNGHIVVKVDDILKKVPHVHVRVDNIIMENGLLAVKVSSIAADVKALQEEKEKEALAKDQAAIEAANLKAQEEAALANFNTNLNHIVATEDEYTRLRKDIAKRVPLDYKKHYEYVAALPDILALAFRTVKDPRVLPKDKAIIGLSMGYFLLPIDFMPDKMPVLGAMDDLALFVFGLNHLLNRIPMPIVVEHWSGDLQTLKFIKDNIGKIMGATKSANIDKIYGLIDDKLAAKFGDYKDDDFYFKNPVAPTTSNL